MTGAIVDDLKGEFTHAADLKSRTLPSRSLCGRRVRYKTYKPGELARLTTPPAPKCAECLRIEAGA